MTNRMLLGLYNWRTLNNLSDDTKLIDFSVGEVEWYNRAYKDLVPVYFDADVTLLRRGAVWFQESLAVGELMLQVQDWLVKVQNGSVQNFEYHSIETEENPVFAVVRDAALKRWRLIAPWAVFEDRADLTDEDVVAFMRKLHNAIASGVKAKYGDVVIRW
ncbi:hypothetical protein [Deinococcus navajonensis]|uniref:DUF7878 domain-containing protein n=1 Tax=Deinococcus navajonensis TaxID=309884 RepID=A0ABV8XIY8_9DEIO